MATIPERETVGLPVGPDKRVIVFREPTEAQWYVITQVPRMFDRGETMQALGAFGDLMYRLTVNQEDRDWLVEQLVNEKLEMPEYAQVATDMMRHFGRTEEEPAPRNGPTPRKRAVRAARRR